MPTRTVLATAAALALGQGAAEPLPSVSSTTTYHRVTVDGVGIFYREAGPRDAPTILLLHGYPSSSRQWDPLLPLLADRYHLIAPDYPGFGQSDAPSPARYAYTFDALAATMGALVEQLGLARYTLFVQDYGGPVGFRMALAHPERVSALIVQNANAYAEGLGPKWRGIAEYWADPAAHPEQIEAFTSFEGARQRHLGTTPNPERYNPDTWADEYAVLARPGERDIQAALLYDYRTNVASYPAWQAWMRSHPLPTLVLWGRYDPSFLVPGADAYRRDRPEAEIHILDAGHFALDEATDAVAQLTRDFLGRHIAASSAPRVTCRIIWQRRDNPGLGGICRFFVLSESGLGPFFGRSRRTGLRRIKWQNGSDARSWRAGSLGTFLGIQMRLKPLPGPFAHPIRLRIIHQGAGG